MPSTRPLNLPEFNNERGAQLGIGLLNTAFKRCRLAIAVQLADTNFRPLGSFHRDDITDCRGA